MGSTTNDQQKPVRSVRTNQEREVIGRADLVVSVYTLTKIITIWPKPSSIKLGESSRSDAEASFYGDSAPNQNPSLFIKGSLLTHTIKTHFQFSPVSPCLKAGKQRLNFTKQMTSTLCQSWFITES